MKEIRATVLGASLLLAYTCAVLLTGRVPINQFAALLVTYLSGSFALWSVLGAGYFIAKVGWAATKSKGRPFLVEFLASEVRSRWTRDRCASLLWPPILFAGLMAAFNAFKQMVLPSAGYGFDPALAAADRALFFGRDGWAVTHAVFGPPATVLIDHLYHGWFVPMAIGVAICAWLPPSTYRLRTQYLLSYMAVWIVLGSLLALVFPSAGPCFYSHLVGPSAGYDALMSRLHQIQAATGEPLMSLRNQALLLRVHVSDHLAIGGGISAMPSVHNGLAVLFAIASWRVSKPLGVLFAAHAAMIWIGSIHLGWHYALDGIVAAALTCGIWRLCGRIAERLERPLVPAATSPALA